MFIDKIKEKRFDAITKFSTSGLEFMWIGFISGISEYRTSTEAIYVRSGTKLDRCLGTDPATAAVVIGISYDIITTAIQSNALIDWTWDANIYPILLRV